MPASPTLSIADNGDDTGAVATLSGSTALSTNVVYTQRVLLTLGTNAWVNQGNRTADGTIAFDLDVGYYWAYCKSSLAGSDALSNLVYFNVTDGISPYHYQCLTAIQAAIVGLTLPDVTNASIIVRKIPLDRWLNSEEAYAKFIAKGQDGGIILPAILICPTAERVDPKAGAIGINEYVYGVTVTSVRNDDMEPTIALNLEEMLLQRQRSQNRFLDQYLAGVRVANECWTEPGDLPNYAAWKNNLLVDSFTVRIRCWIPRP